MPELKINPQVAESLKHWHQMISQNDLSDLPDLLAPEVVFRSPMAHTPYPGVHVVSKILGTVIQVFEDFTYHRELVTADGLNVVLEFSARAEGRELKGIDMIRFDEQGRIVDFEVMIRPMSGLQAVGGEMGRRLGDFLLTAKKAL